MKKKRWKYTRYANEHRLCVRCGRELGKNEVMLCQNCYEALLVRFNEDEDEECQSMEDEEDESA